MARGSLDARRARHVREELYWAMRNFDSRGCQIGRNGSCVARGDDFMSSHPDLRVRGPNGATGVVV
eukprot:4996593-Prymnesium_polylepis.1